MNGERAKARMLLEKPELTAEDWGELAKLAVEALAEHPGEDATIERCEAELILLEGRFRDLDISEMLQVLTKHAVCLAHGNYSRGEFDRVVSHCWSVLDRAHQGRAYQ